MLVFWSTKKPVFEKVCICIEVEGLNDGVMMLFTEKLRGRLIVVAETNRTVFNAIMSEQVIWLGTEQAEPDMLN